MEETENDGDEKTDRGNRKMGQENLRKDIDQF